MNGRRWFAAATVVLALVGAFVAGRYTAPVVVENREVERVVYRDRDVIKTVTVERAARAEVRVVYRDRVVTKDGTVTEREVEKTDTRETEEKSGDAERIATREGAAVRERVVTTTLRPDWRVSVLAGASVRDPLVPLAGPLVLGVQVDRRIVGGLSAGVWASTSGAAGLGISFEF